MNIAIFHSLNSLRTRFLDRCVLRPSRGATDAGDLTRCELSLHCSPSGRKAVIEAFVATNLTRDMVPKTAPSRDATELADWTSAPSPQTLLIKFPGTAGRAERASPFPVNLLPQYSDGGSAGACSQRTDGVLNSDAISRRAEPSVDDAGARRVESSVDNADHYEVWTWNPPGYGRSSGRASLTTLVPTAEAFASQVTSARCGPSTRVWLCGNSLGCLPVLSLSARLTKWLPEQVATDRCLLWLRNPPDLASTILRVADRYASRSWMQRLVRHLPSELDAAENAAKSNVPAVFLMSEYDQLVPPSIQRRIHDAYAGEHRVVTLTALDHGGLIEDQHRSDIQSALHWLTTHSPLS